MTADSPVDQQRKLVTSVPGPRSQALHARKAAAKLQDYGNSVYYHEYLEGGHSVGADKSEDAVRAALLWAFLTKEVGTTR